MAASPFEQKTEEELWLEYKKKKSPQLRDAFIRQYMPLVKYVAGKVSVGMPGSVEFDDLVGFGQFGLLDAINKYDPEKNVKELSFANQELEVPGSKMKIILHYTFFRIEDETAIITRTSL